jgi:hypothetical protein
MMITMRYDFLQSKLHEGNFERAMGLVEIVGRRRGKTVGVFCWAGLAPAASESQLSVLFLQGNVLFHGVK